MLRCRGSFLLVACPIVWTWAAGAAGGADWPMWRCDPNRSGATDERLPRGLRWQWSVKPPDPEPAWPDEPRMRFDAACQPIVANGTMYAASARDGSVRAFDVGSGRETWRFYTNGPVRFAPVAWEGKLFVGSDDGQLYCLDARTGRVRWKLRGGPSDRRVLGNERLISMWPARGGPVVRDGAVYFAAGIWPFMGVFVYALDAETGRVLWCNDATGAIYVPQPHNSPAFAGLAPQGYLVATEEKLLVPNGRAAAAALDRKTGKLLYFRHAENKRNGHSEAAATGNYFVNAGMLCELATGKGVRPVGPAGDNVITRYFQSSYVYFDVVTEQEIAPVGAVGVLAGGVSYQSAGDVLTALDVRRPAEVYRLDYKGRKRKSKDLGVVWELVTRARPLLAAGGRLYAGRRGEILTVDLPPAGRLPELPADDDKPLVYAHTPLLASPKIVERTKIDGTPVGMIAAAGRLLAVTREGAIHCFRPGEGAAPSAGPVPAGTPSPTPTEGAPDVLAAAGAGEGYCLVLGLADGRLAESIARASKLRVLAIDADAAKVDAFRRRIDAAGLPGVRLSAVVADPADAALPPYLASLIVSEDANALLPAGNAAAVASLFNALRPYGGTLCVKLSAASRAGLTAAVAEAKLPGAQVSERGGWTLLKRRGPLPGAGSWTHQYGSPANTCVSEDDLVKAPLGLLWFGGPSNEGILPRHGHGPPEQVIGGRLFIEGPDLLRALDVYTGRLLWQRELEDVGRNYNNTSHEPGAGALGTNFVAAPDGVYVIHGKWCLLLDPATGQTRRRLLLPGGAGDPNRSPDWGYLGVWEDLLVAGASPMKFWSPYFAAEEFGKLDSKTRRPRADKKKAAAMVEAIGRWWNFEIDRPETTFIPPAVPDVEAGPKAEPAGPVEFIVANLNKLMRQGDLAERLGKDVLAAARARDAKDVIKWDRARRLDDYFDRPKPDNVDDLLGLIRRLTASGEPALDDGRTVVMLRRQVIEHCYPELPTRSRPKVGSFTLDHSASSEIVVMDRRTGEVRWRRPAGASFRHNSICLGGGMLFCIDRAPSPVTSRMLRRGVRPKTTAALLALDVRTGRRLWQTTRAVFGTWLSYSAAHDILIQAGRPSRDMLRDEPDDRIIAYRGRTGDVLWDRKESRFEYDGPCMLHGRTIITQKYAFDLLTGKDRMRRNPLTGEAVKWKFKRNYGCNHIVASRHLLTFRSAAAGYYDLTGESGTGNFGGFKSSCTSNLLAADGVLNAPDYTRTCTCSYQNQSSLALIHMPEVQTWTFQDLDRGKEPVRRVGINLGAPGDRMAPDGTLWLEYPYVGGPTPKLDIAADLGEDIDVDRMKLAKFCFRRHPSRVGGSGMKWVAASGLEAAASLTLKLAGSKDAPRTYTVALHFAEPRAQRKGRRVFSVALQDKTVVEDFDVLAEAGAALTPVVKTVRGVVVKDKLRIELTPAGGSELPPILCGVHVVADEP